MNKFLKQKAKSICEFYKLHDTDDISTEALLETCRQEFNLEDVCDVIDALKLGGMLKEVVNGSKKF